ncbi:hypothetical protein DL769_007393 [Monosporascus sp. CRB-8-3]|nr:hypothetical protein DL769_007393 [Monosporascus sp. CRB-8-3]
MPQRTLPRKSSTFVVAKGTAIHPLPRQQRVSGAWAGLRQGPRGEPRFGVSLAEAFGGNGIFPEHVFLLMEQHGFVTCAATIEEAVYQAVCAKEAALAETARVVLRQVYHGVGVESAGGVGALSPEQVELTRDFPARFQPTPWDLWARQAEVDPHHWSNI